MLGSRICDKEERVGDGNMKRLEDLPEAIPVPRLAKFLGVSEPTCYRWIKQGEIPAKRYGKRVIVPRQELAKYLGYGETPKIEARIPKRVIAEIAELARSMAEMNQRLARICEEIGGEYSGSNERTGDGAEAARDQESESAAVVSGSQMLRKMAEGS